MFNHYFAIKTTRSSPYRKLKNYKSCKVFLLKDHGGYCVKISFRELVFSSVQNTHTLKTFNIAIGNGCFTSERNN